MWSILSFQNPVERLEEEREFAPDPKKFSVLDRQICILSRHIGHSLDQVIRFHIITIFFLFFNARRKNKKRKQPFFFFFLAVKQNIYIFMIQNRYILMNPLNHRKFLHGTVLMLSCVTLKSTEIGIKMYTFKL